MYLHRWTPPHPPFLLLPNNNPTNPQILNPSQSLLLLPPRTRISLPLLKNPGVRGALLWVIWIPCLRAGWCPCFGSRFPVTLGVPGRRGIKAGSSAVKPLVLSLSIVPSLIDHRLDRWQPCQSSSFFFLSVFFLSFLSLFFFFFVFYLLVYIH